MNDDQEPLFDVVAVDLRTYAERHIATGKTERNAEAIVSMAVMRRGVDKEFFKTVSAGTPLANGRAAAEMAKEQTK